MRHLKYILILIIFFCFIDAYAQNNDKISDALNKNIIINENNSQYTVWIFFTDKGTDLKSKIITAENNLSKKSLQRRQKLLKNKSVVDHYDIPVEKNYIEKVIPYIYKLRHKSKWLNAISAEISEENLKQIAKMNFVKKIDIVRKGKYHKYSDNKEIIQKNIVPNIYSLNYGSSLIQSEQINVPLVHNLGFNGNGVIICVLDAGFNNLEHQAFSNINIAAHRDFVNNDENVDDEDDMGSGSHGTKTLSTIGGFYEGELIGPAYGATYLLAKTENTDSETQVEEDNWVAAVEWAEELGASITSTSLGYVNFDDGTGYSVEELNGNTAIITIAADIAAGKGILIVNSAGNGGYGTTTISAPADGDSVLAVGAVDDTGIRASFSSVGPTGDGRIKPDVMAMGRNVYVADSNGNNYTRSNGTSFSCPLTAGAAALLWEMIPTASNIEIINALKTTANNANSPNNEYGWGIIDVYAAYEYLVPNFSKSLFISPNPSDNFINIRSIDINDIINEVIIYNISGQVQKHYNNLTSSRIDISNLKPGIYLCKVKSTKQTSVLKFVVAR